MKRSDFELMAPAGSDECLAAAIAAGADSVYFGVGRLNMRAHAAGNFAVGDLPRVMAACRAAGIRGYLALNTVLFDEEMQEMRELIAAAAEAGVSAVIASDMAAATAAQAAGLAVHLSTQLNISNVEALSFYAPLCETAVLARELNLNQVRGIADAVARRPITGSTGKPVKLEMFCHGALCMAMSGRCWMSLHTRGKSANRGECLQNCRRTYRLTDIERGTELEAGNGYVLSPRDLKTIDFLDKMVEAGVTVFKIEGRARGADYVRVVTECYDEALTAIADGSYDDKGRTNWDERLAAVFNRGFWAGHYLGAQTAEIVNSYGSCATERKVFVGRCVNYFAHVGVAQAQILAGEIAPGDKLLITGSTTGAVYAVPEKILDETGNAAHATKGMTVTFGVPQTVRAGDKVYRIERAQK